MTKQVILMQKECRVDDYTFDVIKNSNYVESVDSIGISDGNWGLWYTVVFKDGDTIDIVASKRYKN